MVSFAEHRFHALGTDVGVAVVGTSSPLLLAEAEVRIRRLEARWSRFVATSELCRLNAAEGASVVVPEDTFQLLALAVAAWYRTRGLFDPTVLPMVEAAGYVESYELLTTEARRTALARPTPGCASISLDPVLSAVRVPAGIRLDLGGIATGHVADVVGAQLLAAGAEGARVDLGGDVWCGGSAPTDRGWSIVLDDPWGRVPTAEPACIWMNAGGVATSSTEQRRWRVDGAGAHHLIDPRTGAPSTSEVVSATVVCGSAAWAQVLAKSVVIAGVAEGAALLARCQATGMATRTDGTVVAFAGFEAFSDNVAIGH
jgi:thiamine biosynthesis lipoprotein